MTVPAPAHLKVALLTDSTVFAGTERHMLDLARGLRAQGVETTIACPAAGALGQMALAEGVAVFDWPSQGARLPMAIVALRRALSAGQFSLVHAHNGRTALLAALAGAGAGRVPLITTQHFLAPARTLRRGFLARLANRLHGWVDGRTARIIAISHAVREALIGRGCPPAKATVVHNGISDPRLQALTPRAEVRRALGVPEGVPLLVTSARLEKEKAIGVLIEALALLRPHVLEFRAVVAGTGSEREKLEAMIAREGLAGHVSLVGFRADVLSLVAAADLFILPSPAEPFGLALVEAMALCVPVIATRAGGPCEIIVEGESGLLVEPNHAADLAAAIQRLLVNRPLAAALGEAARLRFEQAFTVPQMAAAELAIYRESLP